MKYGAFSWFSWIFAIVSLLSLSVELMAHVPSTTGTPELPENKKINVRINKNCCISTFFDNFEIENTLLLGYSLHNVGVNPPKTFAFSKNKISEKNREKLSKYFDFVEDSSNATSELLGNCFPLISVSSQGVFNKSPWDVCNFVTEETLPAAVPQQGDIVYPDTAMLVVDPRNMTESLFKSFGGYKGPLDKWFNLPSEFSVYDYNNDFLDFWMTYSSPTYIHYSSQTYQELVNGAKKTEDGSYQIYKVLKLIYSDAMKSIGKKE